MYYVYILKSERDNKIYIGSTSNLKKRLKQHSDGRVEATHYRLPLELVYYEAYREERIARKREKVLKRGKAHMELKKRLNIN